MVVVRLHLPAVDSSVDISSFYYTLDDGIDDDSFSIELNSSEKCVLSSFYAFFCIGFPAFCFFKEYE